MIDVGIAFFILGVLIKLVRAEIQFPQQLYQSLALFLMIAISLKGGVALHHHLSWDLIVEILLVLPLGIIIPLITYPVLVQIGKLDKATSASIAAHYGSISIATYAVAVGFLESQNILYEQYIPLFAVVLEVPAIAVGIALARYKSNKSDADNKNILHEMFFNQGVVVITGSLIVGCLAGPKIDQVAPFFFGLFNGVLSLFLLYMGMEAANRAKDIREAGVFIILFGTITPIVGGVFGSMIGVYLMQLSLGGATLLGVLGASSSYIAVPAAMRVAIPESNHSLSIGTSLGVTFSFNVVFGIFLVYNFTKFIS
jgi:hypothetical protein